ncbi:MULTISPECIES: DUF3990 domain-containing protein [unclassified Adlercreutzia]|uniref:DUF3990 domain-containing protein n=1 Tax=unclassified Adlercreutzia TaxID=2636013 RepID=UPI0013EDE00E|nr:MULTISPECIES: DUF3990 domain-containing protein [unclassified Adlercreutzia]
MVEEVKLLFHGSYLTVREPRVITGAYAKDFGEGFYLTLLQEQAERWALRKFRNLRRTDPKARPIVTVYRFEKSRAVKNCPSLLFPQMSDEWLDFVASCRGGVPHGFAYVEGPMANDKVYNFVESFLAGSIGRDEFWRKARFSYPTHQVMLADEALPFLHFVESYDVEERS